MPIGRRIAGLTIAVALGAFCLGVAQTDASEMVTAGVYVGAIGTHAIVLELGNKGASGDTAGFYFYRDVGVGIALHRVRTSDLQLVTIRDPFAAPTHARRAPFETWELVRAAGGFRGTWRSSDDARELPIRLQRIADAEQLDPREENARAYLAELVRFRIGRSAVEVRNGVAFRFVRDRRYRVGSIELEHVPNEPPSIRPIANEALRREFDQQRSRAYACAAENRWYHHADAYDLRMTVAFVTSAGVTLDERGEVGCGGAHPEFLVEPFTVDFRTGIPVDWQLAVRDGLAVTRPYAKQAPFVTGGFRGTRQPCFAPEIIAEITGYTYGLRATGLDVHPDLGHAIAACAVDVVVPVAQAKPMLRPAYRHLLDRS